MSSDRILLGLLALTLVACADVRRGESWDAPKGDAAEAGAGPMPADDGDDGDGDDDSAVDDGSTGGGDDGGSSGGAEAISYAAEIFGILDAGCERCHSAGGQASDTSFVLTGDVAADYDETLPFVDLGAPASSRLLAKGAGAGHIGGVIYDEASPQYATILAWIEQGAMP